MSDTVVTFELSECQNDQGAAVFEVLIKNESGIAINSGNVAYECKTCPTKQYTYPFGITKNLQIPNPNVCPECNPLWGGSCAYDTNCYCGVCPSGL